MTDYWKYVKPDPKGLEENPYINPPTPAAPSQAAKVNNAKPVVVTPGTGFITLENVVCTGSDGKKFEKYDKIDVAIDVIRKTGEATHISFTPYDAINYFEQQNNGLFLPSFALSCNVLAALFSSAMRKEKDGSYKTLNSQLKQVLDQYLDHGAGWGWHAQNTVVNWKSKEIIHYPHDADFPTNGGNSNINKSSTQRRLSFKPIGFGDVPLQEALKKDEFKKYLINLTGLSKPATLVEIGNYYTKIAGKDKKAFVWVPNNPIKADYTAAAWLGCYVVDFCLDTNTDLGNYDAARGVRSSPR